MTNYLFKTINNEVINFCGEYPENFIEVDVLSNPEYVFENDTSLNLCNYLILKEIKFL